MKLSIYRYDPDKDERPYLKDYDVQLEQPAPALPLQSIAPDLLHVRARAGRAALRRCAGPSAP